MPPKNILEISQRILDLNPDPVPRFRLLRDVLQIPQDDGVLASAKHAMLNSRWVKQLEDAQEVNGSWGRFHSQDTKVKKPFRTTEEAIRRALALGLTAQDEVLKRAIGYMEAIMEGREHWTDQAEKHEGWPVNIRVITAATLATIVPDHPLLVEFQNRWLEILHRTFASGSYDPLVERQAHRELHGIVTPGKYLHLGMLYPLLILSSIPGGLPTRLEQSLLQWLWNREEGIYYVTPRSLNRFPDIDSPTFPAWLDGLELISRFMNGRQVVSRALDWINAQKNSGGFWDLGPRARTSIYFPLSEDWRIPGKRVIDGSVRILLLLKKFS